LVRLIVSRIARTRGQLLKCDVKSCGRTTDITATTDASYAGPVFRRVLQSRLRVGRRHCSAGTVSAENLSARRSNPTSPVSRGVRNAVGPSVRRYAHAPQAARSARADRNRRSRRAMCSTPVSGRRRRRLPIEAACLQAAITRSTVVLLGCRFSCSRLPDTYRRPFCGPRWKAWLSRTRFAERL
jgi:hypothetical protein